MATPVMQQLGMHLGARGYRRLRPDDPEFAAVRGSIPVNQRGARVYLHDHGPDAARDYAFVGAPTATDRRESGDAADAVLVGSRWYTPYVSFASSATAVFNKTGHMIDLCGEPYDDGIKKAFLSQFIAR